MYGRMIFLVLLGATVSFAQPWQWERVEEDVYNISGFPEEQFVAYNYFNEICADFDGDSADEYFRDFGDYYVIGNLVSTNPPHWETIVVNENLSGGTMRAGAEAMHLDRDGRKELILFGPEVRCYKWVNSDPWTWERHDELLAGLWFPEETYDAALGDYDYDGMLNLVAYTGGFDAEFYERDSSGVWREDSIWADPIGPFFDGDFDDDGDEDFAVVGYLLHLDDSYSMFYENTGNGIVRHESGDSYVVRGPGGGDLDGDGEWEFLSYSGEGPMRYQPLGYHLQEVETDTEFVHVTDSRALGRPEGIIETRLYVEGVGYFAALQARSGSPSCPWGDCFQTALRGEEEWSFQDFGLQRPNMGPGRLSFGFLNGDNRKDVLQVTYVNSPHRLEYWSLRIWTGNEIRDSYGELQDLAQFAPGLDTVYTSPQLCELDGTQGSELVVLLETTSSDARPLFYDIEGTWPGLEFVRRDDWGIGQFPTFELVRMADIDNDGYSELMGRANGEWQSWFLRNGVWWQYPSILPQFESSDVSFVDYDNDGDLDLFTLDDVYLSLSPTAANEPPVGIPEQLSLSAYPNPFNGEVRLGFEVGQNERVSLIIYDLGGRRVQTLLDRRVGVGAHELHWDARGLTSGVYFAKLEAGDKSAVTKVMLVK